MYSVYTNNSVEFIQILAFFFFILGGVQCPWTTPPVNTPLHKLINILSHTLLSLELCNKRNHYYIYKKQRNVNETETNRNPE